jgi:hypothetical protein
MLEEGLQVRILSDSSCRPVYPQRLFVGLEQAMGSEAGVRVARF